ncbi:kinase-like protein, partial [Dendrothele bispora CBS 962.96]
MSVDLSILKASATNAEGIAELENDFIALLGPYDAFSREPQPGTLYGGENGELYRRIELALGDQVSYQKLLSQRGERAQYFLDLLQMLYDYPHASDPKVRSNIFSAMIRLSKTSGLYPTCLVLNGVNKIGEHPVSSGGFGEIWKGSIGEQLACLKVVRVYGDSDVQKLLKEFLKEAILWRQLDHPNVLPFLGIYFLDTTKQRVCLISPWMENGNLRRYLRDRSDAHRDVDHFLLSYDIACGLLYLHEKKVIHGDLKAENVLITPTGRAAIADFGLSRVANSEALNWSSLSTSNQGRGGSARWLAPECLIEGNNVTYASDVYAFGGVCYEVFTGLIPFHECTHDAAVIFQLMKGKRPTRPSDASTRLNDEIWGIMQDCWDQEPFERPVTNTLPSRL